MCCTIGRSTQSALIQLLPAPEIFCVEEDYFSVVVGWDEIPGVSYTASASLGNGVVSGNTFRISQLPDGEDDYDYCCRRCRLGLWPGFIQHYVSNAEVHTTGLVCPECLLTQRRWCQRYVLRPGQ